MGYNNREQINFTLSPELSVFANEQLSGVTYIKDGCSMTLEGKLGDSYPAYLNLLRIQLAYWDTYKYNLPKKVHEKRNGARLEAAEAAKKQGLSEHLIDQAAAQAKQICRTYREVQSAHNSLLLKVGGENPSVYLGDGSHRKGFQNSLS